MKHPLFNVQLFGDFRLVYDDIPVTTVNTPRIQSLLAYLLLHRSAPQSRRHLAFLLWPDSTEAQARTNLRHQFHLLRQALPAVDLFLLTDTQTVQWRSDIPCCLDVVTFEVATGEDASLIALQEAVTLYRGDLLPSCYDDWILPLRERLRQRFIETLERLIGRLEQEHDYTTAIRYAQRLRQFDPLHEATYRHLMRLYALSDDPAGVQHTYQECRTILQRELDVTPTPATTQAYAQLVQENTALGQRHNLPGQLTPFLGRAEELTRIANFLADPTCRLLTLVGLGGIGKTRLAVQSAQAQIGAYLHGVYLVTLASASSSDFIISALAASLNFAFYDAQDPQVQLLNYLREKEMLVVLDSFEHLLAGAGLLTAILTNAPGLKLLVTSRERLKLPGEWLLEVQGLAVPDAQAVADLEQYSAAQLFVQSARRVQPDFSLTAEQQSAIVRLCQLVEGMPLVLELAATWVRLLTCQEIVHELTQSLDLLSSSSENVPERHRNMRAVFDHSWNLLTPTEQQVLRRLVVFQGGFRRDAAKQVAGASLALLAALVDKSLVRWNRLERYEMHELIRQYTAEKLAGVAAEKEMTQDRHGRYYLEFLRQQEERLKSSQSQQALREIRIEMDNVRLAWQWAFEHGWARELGQATQTLWLFYDAQGWYHEAEALFRQAIGALPMKQKPESWQEERQRRIGLGQLLAQQGWFLLQLGLIRKAKALFQQSVTLLRRFGTRAELADTLQVFSMGAWMEGDYQAAQAMLQEGLAIFSEEKAGWDIAVCFLCLGNVATLLGNYGEARHLLQQALALSQKTGEPKLTSLILNYLGPVAYTLGDYIEAKRWSQESLTLSREIGDRWSMIMSLNHLGVVTYLGGAADWPKAQRLHEESFNLAQSLGNRREMAVARNYLGYMACAMADYPTAGQHFFAALQMAIEIQLTPLALNALVGLATMFCQQPTAATVADSTKKNEQAIELLALVLSHPAAAQETKDKAQLLWSELAATLAPPLLVAAQERGHARTLEAVATDLLAESTTTDSGSSGVVF